MGGNTNRQPVPAGGAPIPSAIEAADQTPPATNAEAGEQQGDHASDQGDDGKHVEARVLLDHDGYAVNDVICAPADVIERLKLAGVVDPHSDAVAFAKGG